MKRLFILFTMILLLAACSDDGLNKDENQDINTEIEAPKSEYTYPSEIEEVGTGTVVIDTASGDSTDGNVPVMFIEEDTIMTQIGYTIEDFNGDKEVFFFVNEVFIEATQGGEMSMLSLDLDEWLLEPGIYEVAAVQFADNDPTNEVVQLSKTQYKIEEGS